MPRIFCSTAEPSEILGTSFYHSSQNTPTGSSGTWASDFRYARSGLRGGATFGGLPISPATPPPGAALISGSNEATIPTSAEIASKLALSGANAGTWTGNLPAPGTGSADNSAFEILGDQLRLKIPADYESKDSYRIHLEATDPGGLTFGKSLTVQVLDANEAPSNLTLSHSQMVENQAVGSVIGAFSASDPDTNETLSYWLMGHSHPTNQLFSLQATNGVLRTANSSISRPMPRPMS